MEIAENSNKKTFKDKLRNFFNLSFLLIIVFFILGLIIGRVWRLSWLRNMPHLSIINELRAGSVSQNSFKFINPLLGCEVAPKRVVPEFNPLKIKLEQLINNKIANNEVENVSVYFDTRDGRWLGINENQTYSPASLLKVPIMIAFFKMAELNPKILSKKVIFEGDYDLNQAQNFKSTEVLEPYKYYTIENLIERMIVYSDNNTLPLLVQNMKEDTLKKVYSDLGLSDQRDYSAKMYARFFRVLYNGTYLNKEMSEKALELLSRANFLQGIRAGLPENMVMAEKFGERNFLGTASDPQRSKELHDCGIVYFPEHPYLLCVMTKGNNFDKLSAAIKDISSFVYANMSSELNK